MKVHKDPNADVKDLQRLCEVYHQGLRDPLVYYCQQKCKFQFVVPSTTLDLLSCDFQNEGKVVPDIIYQIGESFLWHAQEKCHIVVICRSLEEQEILLKLKP